MVKRLSKLDSYQSFSLYFLLHEFEVSALSSKVTLFKNNQTLYSQSIWELQDTLLKERQRQLIFIQPIRILFICCIIVKLCLHFCVCVSKSLRKWTQTDTKVTLHPPTCPPENFFWSQMKGMAKIRLFYSGDMAFILPR